MPSVIRGTDNFDSSDEVGASRWESSGFTANTASSNWTFTHNKNKLPLSAHFEMTCTTADDGFSVGDKIILHSGERYANWGMQIMDITTTTVEVGRYSAGLVWKNQNTTSSDSKDINDWQVKVILAF